MLRDIPFACCAGEASEFQRQANYRADGTVGQSPTPTTASTLVVALPLLLLAAMLLQF